MNNSWPLQDPPIDQFIEGEHPSLINRPLHNLKDGEAFAIFDSNGDMGRHEAGAEGLFYKDTRHLSRLDLRIGGRNLVLLNSATHDDKSGLSVDLTNPDLTDGSETISRETIFMERTKILWNATCYERISIRNFGSAPCRFQLDYSCDADFHDLFEVRGTARPKRGDSFVRVTAPDVLNFEYVGLDAVRRRTVISFTPTPERLGAGGAVLDVSLAAGEQKSIFVSIGCEHGEALPIRLRSQSKAPEFFHAYRESRRARRAQTADIATVHSSSELFNEVACRATSDVYTLITSTASGAYPYAGIPWFSTVFGRDGIFTAMFMLWIDASIAKGVLRTLAQTQATVIDRSSDAQPGKILHELRRGEMANLGEVPFRRYYGSVDSTPLFVMLAGLYFDATGDLDTINEIWPNIECALTWVDTFGDRDGDGFVEYAAETNSSLINQGWKDSHDSVFHMDGSDARGPIALCEVQGYVYAAKEAASKMAAGLGKADLARSLSVSAETLRVAIEQTFWDEELGSYVLALDGSKRPCRVRASNAGHLLFTGTASPDRARRVADQLMSRNSFSGWGVRTLAQGEPRYNPMSYHNGSIWPHDNAVIAIGLARYGMKAEALRIFEGLFDAAKTQELRRLPELFCGFSRHPMRGPTPYPVACSPQAWAASAIFGVLGACLGLEQLHAQNELRFREPLMPAFMNEVVLCNLHLGLTRADLRMHRYGNDIATTLLTRRGSARISVLK